MLNENTRIAAQEGLKKQLNACYRFCSAMDNAGLSKALGMSMKKQCQNDVIVISLFFAMADGVVAQEEADLLNHILECNISASRYQEIYTNAKIDKNAFLSRKVMTLEIAKILDEVMKSDSSVKVFIDTFINIAKIMISIDGDIDEEEMAAIVSYQTNLELKYL